MLDVICQREGCNKEFRAKPDRVKKGLSKYCSRDCYYEGRKAETILRNKDKWNSICARDGCENKFYALPSKKKAGHGKFCCHECYGLDKRGKTLSKVHKQKIGQWTKDRWEDGTFGSEEHLSKLRGKPAWNKGISPSDETREKMSNSQLKRYEDPRASELVSERSQKYWDDPKNREKQSERMKKMHEDDPTIKVRVSETLQGRIFTDEHRENLSIAGRGKHKGEKSWSWKGGVSSDPYSDDFTPYKKKKVRKRDKQLCRACGCNAKGLPGIVHHLDGDKSNSKMDNLVLLCTKCHGEVHAPKAKSNDPMILAFRSMLYQ